ncbi:hypothetical protein AGMMS49983_06010 [Clostridia bacterium]|nr:hypothetical protein AGMMS49983_06010 [Clostridia bacterium]
MTLTSKQRYLACLNREKPDCLPASNHFVMPSFLKNCMNGISAEEFFDKTGVDPILWTISHTFDPDKGEYFDPQQGDLGFLEAKRISTDQWRIYPEKVAGTEYDTTRFNFVTPNKTLSMVLAANEHTAWVTEHLIKEQSDIEILAKYMTSPTCDVADINQQAEAYGERGLVRGWICCFDIFGQPGTWQDACCLHGTEEMIMAAYDDPEWVHEFLQILYERKLHYIKSLKGAKYDIHELGGGSASSTVINPYIFDHFVAPYDSKLIAALHDAGQRVSYHTCGGMMPFLERIVAMGPDAIETLTPPAMGADVDLSEVKRRVGDKVCLIGGFDQFHYLINCTPEQTRAEVRRCFEAAGEGGGYILCTSDNYFEADPELIKVFADEAHKCVY